KRLDTATFRIPEPAIEGDVARLIDERAFDDCSMASTSSRHRNAVAFTDQDCFDGARASSGPGFSFATPSMVAHVASDKFCDGLPLHRQEDRFARLGMPIDRGTMCRWLEEAGATVGATVVEAMRREALTTAHCIATDATGVLVQPEPRPDKQRQP